MATPGPTAGAAFRSTFSTTSVRAPGTLPYLGLAAMLCLTLFVRLGTPSFWDPDEAHYAQTSREMIDSGDWVAPYYNEQPFFDKPALFHWLQGASMRLLGPSELAARLPSALGGLALVAFTWWLGAQLAGPHVGWLSALLLAANPGLFALARYAILDTIFSALLFGGVGMVTVAALRDRPPLQYAGYVLIGLATFVKGPIALILCSVAFLIVIAISGDARRRFLSLRLVAGAAIALAIPLPWFVVMLRRFGADFIQGYVLNENVLLFATPLYANQPPWWFYLGILASGLLPWTPMIVGRLADSIRASVGRTRTIDTVDLLLWSWTVAIVGFFSVSSFKLDHYVFPAAPALCIIGARAWTDATRAPAGPEHAGARIGIRLIGPTLILVGIAAGVVGMTRLDLPAAAVVVPAALIVTGVVAAIRYRWRPPGPPRVPAAALTALAFAYAGATFVVMPTLEREKVVPDVAAWVRSHATSAHQIATMRLNRWNPAYRYYVERHTLMLETDQEILALLSSSTPFYCVMMKRDFDELASRGIALDVVYRRQGLRVTSGRALWRRNRDTAEFLVTTRPAGTSVPAAASQ
jgi:4-amino-4-deoxy-L-arabinose transferase-like glycosyltransferase